MRKLFLLLSAIITGSFSFCQDLSYYLPQHVSYNPSIPVPKEVIYHEVGEWHVTHDRLVNYMKAIAAAAPQRVKLETMGYTYEGRPQLLLIITSPKNHANLETIRQQHVALTDPAKASSVHIDNLPAVVWVGHSIHGNESSGANAALLSAYYLASAQGKQVEELLEHVIILFDPCFNPDGLQRFSSWVNQHKSKNLVTDPNSREFNEVWPGGRFNHYWFDLNRDWLPAMHVESRNRLKWYHQWKPNILTDHHEMGGNATFFFQPGVPTRVNPLTPDKNQELTAKIGKFHAAFLDSTGSLYYSREGFDDFYYGKGSTYPDVQGCIGILFEQASSRGHAVQTVHGILRFPFTIKNQFVTTLSTLEAAKVLRKELLEYQRDFFRQSVNRAAAYPVKGYVFGDRYDKARTFHFAEMLRHHQVEINYLPDNFRDGEFDKDAAFMVSLNQPQHSLIRSIFEKTFDYKDSLFYDITSWTMPLAFGIPYKELTGTLSPGLKVESFNFPKGEVVGKKSSYAYLLEWNEYYAPAALYELLNADVLVKASTNEFEMMIGDARKKFNPGTLQIPVKLQKDDEETLAVKISAVAEKYRLKIYTVSTGQVLSGSDLGSNRFVTLAKPSIAMITGPGVNALDAGEVWHLLDQRMNIPSTHLEPAIFNRVDLGKYNTLIMVGGNYPDLNRDKLKAWVQGGGTLILTEEAVMWAAQNGITDIKSKRVKSPVDSLQRLSYTDRVQIEGAQQMSGAIFGADVDLAHPMAYGYNQKTVSLFKNNRVFIEKSRNPYATPFYYRDKPLQSGWMSRENLEAIKNSAAVVVSVAGNGRVISIADNPNFRAFWLGGSKLFMNAIFFGRIIDAASARTGE
jgi:hypothetical protein